MTVVPLHEISISDFRRLKGHRTLPLDAPIVLLHGPNGSGKTSVLSALELALTGEIRSMRRHDPRYTAHLPFHGQDFATVRVSVGEQLKSGSDTIRMTVGGSRIEGPPALTREAAQFYAERCYLDQVSLGQLLELYQYREGREESALARFVNELLGLEQLDALRSGLSDAEDFRLLKKLSEPLADAEREEMQARSDLSETNKELDSARAVLAGARERLAEAMGTLGLEMPTIEREKFISEVSELLRSSKPTDGQVVYQDINKKLTALGGRIEGLANRPSVKRMEESKDRMAAARVTFDAWRKQHEAGIERWRADAAGLLEGGATGEGTVALGEALQQIDESIARHGNVVASVARLEQQLANRRKTLLDVELQLSVAREQAGSLVEGLTALRDHCSDNVCPVCDRDFSEVVSTRLTAHIDRKIKELSEQGVRLRDLREQRDVVTAEVQRSEQELEQVRVRLLSAAQLEDAISRRAALAALQVRLQSLQPAIDSGLRLQMGLRAAEAEFSELESIALDAKVVGSELEWVAELLGASPPVLPETLQDAWRRLTDTAAERLAQATALQRSRAEAASFLEEIVRGSERVMALREAMTAAAEREITWKSRVQEARRRQVIARQVYQAASNARTAIVQHVFTESLNEVWRSVFARLAPREPFVPAFGIPTTGKAALELKLETVHVSGETGGSPQMMLSAGNLNTAALSLFIALHLSVEPLVPCLVFDDPVQSMDEVHIAQFAGLIRVLSKHHDRQVIIAVHERALFEYLALELSPAFAGDELITIELGAKADDERPVVNRLAWSPDPAIAV